MARQAQETPADAGGAADLPPPSHRGLKIAVIVMGILLVVGFTVVFSTIIYRAVKIAPGESAAAAAQRGFGVIEAGRSAGAQIGRVILDGDRLAVELHDEAGGEIVIFDLRRGGELGRIRFVTR